MPKKLAYCSWCFNKTYHIQVEDNKFSRNVYECTECKNQTLACRYCSNMAKGKPSEETVKSLKLSGFLQKTQSWNNELCAEHDGTIANFSSLSMQINDISEYEKIFIRDKYNLAKAGKLTAAGVAGVVSVAGIAMTGGTGAAPIAAALGNLGLLGTASTGVAISSLSGAALTSASLAAIGGSMAAGTLIISAAGLALGGTLGGVIANKYHGEDKSFAISKLRESDSDVRTIYINGFTQEDEINFYDWQIGELAFGSKPKMYSVTWSSETNAKLGKAFAKGVGSQVAKKLIQGIAKTGGKKAASKLSPVGWLTLIGDMLGNPWHSSMFRAAQAGIQLAEAISRTHGQKFNLVGHSLGCRVIYYALEALATKEGKYINDVILLGGAIGKDDIIGWEKAMSSVSGNLYNCHSSQDQVLTKIYQIANAGLSSPIGINPIELDNAQLHNIDCTKLVDSHMTWKKHYEKILRKIHNL